MKRRGATTEALAFVIVVGFVCVTVFVTGIFPHVNFVIDGNLSVSDITNIISAIATGFASLATILIAYFAMKSNEQARESADKTNQIAENIERERTRPRIVFEGFFQAKFVWLKVKNRGLTPARNVTIKTPLKITEDVLKKRFESAFGRTITAHPSA